MSFLLLDNVRTHEHVEYAVKGEMVFFIVQVLSIF